MSTSGESSGNLGATLDHALAMVFPGGLLVTATAPRQPLCVLTELRSPGDGHRLWCAEDVTAAMTAEVRERVLAYLVEVALPGRPGVAPHPIDITIA